MGIRTISNGEDLRRYKEWILAHPQANLWQSLERKKYVETCGKSTKIYVDEENDRIVASALVVIDRTTGGFSVWDIPRGPLFRGEPGAMSDEKITLFLDSIIEDAKKDRCLALYLSPMLPLGTQGSKLKTSPRRIHAEATRILDLTQSEEQLLAGMHPKGRYNIGVARKHGVAIETCESHVSTASDIDTFYQLLQNTGSRDGFKISQKSHYARFLSALEGSFLLLAKHEGKAIAGLIGVIWSPPPLTPPPKGEGNLNRTGIYYYGASSYEHRHLMAPYLLQWEAMLYCKKANCTRYDLLGIAPASARGDDPWMGITEFKSKFGGYVVSYPPEHMIVLRPIAKKLLEWKRRVMG